MLTLWRSHPFFLIAIYSPVSNFLSALRIKKDNKDLGEMTQWVQKCLWQKSDDDLHLISRDPHKKLDMRLCTYNPSRLQWEKNPPATCGPASLECLLQQKKQDFVWNRGRRDQFPKSCPLIPTCRLWHRQSHGHTHMHVHKIFIHSQKDFPKDPVNTWSEKICSHIPSTQLVNSETKEWVPEFLT